MTGALRTNRELLLPLVLPYVTYVSIGNVAGSTLGPEIDYMLRIALAGGILVYVWPHLLPLRGPGSPAGSLAWGALAGVVGLGVWIAALAPLSIPEAGVPWNDTAWLLRLLAATLLVPLLEEPLLRGWVLGAATQWDRLRRAGEPEPLEQAWGGRSLLELEPHAWTPPAVAISCAAFALGHAPVEWPAALLYGGLMAGLRIWRGDLLSCIAAHAVTNLGLAVYVRSTGSWALW